MVCNCNFRTFAPKKLPQKPSYPRHSETLEQQNIMLHHSTIIPHSPLQHHQQVSLSSPLPHYLSFPSGLRSSSTSLRIVRISEAHNNNKDPVVKSTTGWSALYKRISFMRNPEMGAGFVLNQHVKEGKRVSKWELWRIAQKLRQFGMYRLALEVLITLETVMVFIFLQKLIMSCLIYIIT